MVIDGKLEKHKEYGENIHHYFPTGCFYMHPYTKSSLSQTVFPLIYKKWHR